MTPSRITAKGKRSVVIDGNVSGSTIITGDMLFQLFDQTPLVHHIRVEEFRTLVKERSRDFTGREFVINAIGNKLNDSDFKSGYIVVRGEPGIGKTSLLSYLVAQHGYLHHFNIAVQNIRSPRDFLSNICAQLITRYGLDHTVLPPDAEKDSGFLSQLLMEVAAQPKNRPVLILVDALDEADELGLPLVANQLFLPSTLPDGIFFLLTTRTKADERLAVDSRHDIYLEANDPRNLNDAQEYIQNFIRKNRGKMIAAMRNWGISEGEFVSILTEKSQGNFMYLVYVLADIRDQKMSLRGLDNMRELPQGLRDYYKRHWRLMRMQRSEQFEQYYEPVICMLAIAREPVSIPQLVEWTGLPHQRTSEVIREWLEFLHEDRGSQDRPRYRLYHTSFQDFLREEVGLARYHEAISRTLLKKIRS